MKAEAQIVALLEWMGWRFVPIQLAHQIDKWPTNCSWRNPKGEPATHDDAPPLTLDLMHEAENKLTNEQRRFYIHMLIAVHPLHYDPFQSDDGYMRVFHLANATKEQRLEALLKTIGKWVE